MNHTELSHLVNCQSLTVIPLCMKIDFFATKQQISKLVFNIIALICKDFGIPIKLDFVVQQWFTSYYSLGILITELNDLLVHLISNE